MISGEKLNSLVAYSLAVHPEAGTAGCVGWQSLSQKSFDCRPRGENDTCDVIRSAGGGRAGANDQSQAPWLVDHSLTAHPDTGGAKDLPSQAGTAGCAGCPRLGHQNRIHGTFLPRRLLVAHHAEARRGIQPSAISRLCVTVPDR